MKKVSLFIKRLLDILVSLTAIIILSPIIVIISIIVYVKLGKPIFFRQIRPGFQGKPFKMYKFRTMLNDTDKHGNLLEDKDRLTNFGKRLRSTSLDELPELFNILKGNMSFVGPRPLLMEYLPLYSSEQKKRHDMPPGLTGWAQINGRNSISWEEKFKLDIWYVNHWNLLLDLKVFIMTISTVFKKEGINQEGNVTMYKFNGKN